MSDVSHDEELAVDRRMWRQRQLYLERNAAVMLEAQKAVERLAPVLKTVPPQLDALLSPRQSNPLIRAGLRPTAPCLSEIKRAGETALEHADTVRQSFQNDSVQQAIRVIADGRGKEVLHHAQQAIKIAETQIAPVLEKVRPQMEAILRHLRVRASRRPRRSRRIRATARQRSSSSRCTMTARIQVTSTLVCCDPATGSMRPGELPAPPSDAPVIPPRSRAYQAHREALASVCIFAGRDRASTSPTNKPDAPPQRCAFRRAQRARDGASFSFIKETS